MDRREFETAVGRHKREIKVFEWWPPSMAEFRETFDSLLTRINDGELTKAVPVVFETAEGVVSSAILAGLLSNVLSHSPQNLCLYGCWSNGSGVLGATPERLFTQPSANRVHTMALGGTSPACISDDEFLSDQKSRKEHQLVIDDIVAVLGCMGELTVGPTTVLRLALLSHLQTLIELKSGRPIGYEELVKMLHPTPALGVAPRSAGFGWLLGQNENNDRQRFGAPFGVAHKQGESICVVAIRNIQWDQDRVVLGAGCGIIKESVYENEWHELALKRLSVKRLLHI